MSILDATRADEVHNATTLCKWASAAYGVPPPTLNDIKVLNKKAKELFETIEGTDWQTIVAVIKWCHQNKRRYGRIWSYVGQYRFAWADGVFDFSAPTTTLDEEMQKAISEADPVWRGRLLRSVGDARAEVLAEWKTYKGYS